MTGSGFHEATDVKRQSSNNNRCYRW